LTTTTLLETPSFARLLVTDKKTNDSAKVEFGIDWRAHPPTILSIGPVLHQDDAVANKITALYSRAQTRDYIDVNATLNSGRYTGEELLTLALDHDPGFDRQLFAQALMAVERLPLAEFTAYDLSEEAAKDLITRLTSWATEIIGS
jgi:hypothetical protein